MGDTGQQHIRPSLLPCADSEGQAQAPDWSKSDPYPGGPLGGAIKLSARQMRFLGMPETPQRLELAFAHMQSVPEVQPDGATVARHPMQPGTDRILVHLDDAGGRAQGIAFRQRPHCGLTNRRIGLQAVIRGTVTPDHTRFARCTPRPRLPTAGPVLDQLPL
jgi:hypothetical protein